jgi:hypothetical protein
MTLRTCSSTWTFSPRSERRPAFLDQPHVERRWSSAVILGLDLAAAPPRAARPARAGFG